MKKLFIGLLIVAAGAGAFFFFNKKKDNNEVATINKELIIGKWKVDSIYFNADDTVEQFNLVLINTLDSNYLDYQYDFSKQDIITSLDNKIIDTSHYEWNKADQLVWNQNVSDSTGTVFSVFKLTQDSLQLFAKDSSTILFTKMK